MIGTGRHKTIWGRTAAAILAVLLALLTAACGGDAQAPSSALSGQDASSEESPAEESTVEESPAEKDGAEESTAPKDSVRTEEEDEDGTEPGSSAFETLEVKAATSAPETEKAHYEPPAFRNSVFDADAAEGNEEVLVDLSSLSEGYVAIHVYTEAKIKFQVVKDDNTITYSVVCGKDQVFPLQSGDGHYVFKVMKNIVDKKYAELYRCEADVVIPDAFDPFLRPNQYADYTQESECVKLAASFAKEAGTQEEFISKVYSYIREHVTYDHELAAAVKSGYLPDPDRTLEENKGICFDYACLAASMLRSQGVPAKIIFGYVAPDDLYHAWNKFYTEKDGWTLVEFTVSGSEWNRIDLTFSANGADAQFIGDGTNYLEANQF